MVPSIPRFISIDMSIRVLTKRFLNYLLKLVDSYG